MLTASLFVCDKYAGVQMAYSVLQIKQTSVTGFVPSPLNSCLPFRRIVEQMSKP